MTYYQAIKYFISNGWKCVKHFDNKEVWMKDEKSFVISVQDNLPKQLVESVVQ